MQDIERKNSQEAVATTRQEKTVAQTAIVSGEVGDRWRDSVCIHQVKSSGLGNRSQVGHERKKRVKDDLEISGKVNWVAHGTMQ